MKKHSFKGRLLYKYLKQHRVLEDYIKEVFRQKPNYSGVQKYETDHDILDFFDVFDDIDRALYWRDTSQGHEYWSHMHYSFRTLLTNEEHIRLKVALQNGEEI